MKLVYYLLPLLFLSTANAQYNVVKVDGLSLLFPNPRVFRPSYERSVGRHFSFLATFETGRYDLGEASAGGGMNMITVYEVTGWGIMPEVRYYPFTGGRKVAPVGFFIGLHYRYKFLKEDYNEYGIHVTSRGHSHDLGVNAGYKLRAGRFINCFTCA